MASLPPLRRLLLDDFKSQKSWLGPLLLIINNFAESVVNALDKSLTIGQNSTGDFKTITLSSVPTASAPASVAWSKKAIPIAVFVGNCVQSSGAAFTLTNAVQVQWSMSSDGKSLQLTNVVGITPSTTTNYILTLLCLTG